MKERKLQISNFSILPDDCIAKIFSLASASPKDVCRASITSRDFKSASESDAVWERFLPPDYEQIISRSVSPPVYTTKKELYFWLCSSLLLLDGGKLSFTMNKLNGKRSLMLSARKLSISGIDNPMHWKWTSISESRFPEVAELVKVGRLEIQAKVPQMLSLETIYIAHLVYKLIENAHSYGLKFHMKSSIEYVRENTGETEHKCCNLWLGTPPTIPGLPRALKRISRPPTPRPQMRMDGWTEIQLGEFLNGHGGGGEVKIQLLGKAVQRWKGGLVVEGIEIRPKEQ